MLSCRACAHPIELAEAGVTCDRCGALHVLLQLSRAGVALGTEDENDALREIVQRLDAGDVRRANDLYRATFACGLVEASRALEVLAEGGAVRLLSLVAAGPVALEETDLPPELRAKTVSSSSV